MTFKNKILQEYAEKIGNEYNALLASGETSYNAVFILCERYDLSRFTVYRYIKKAGYKVRTENRPLNDKGKFAPIIDRKVPIDN